MEIVTLNQPTSFKDKSGRLRFEITCLLPNGTKKSLLNTTESNYSEVKNAVVNIFLKDGFRAPQSEIAKYINRGAGTHGSALVMTKG